MQTHSDADADALYMLHMHAYINLQQRSSFCMLNGKPPTELMICTHKQIKARGPGSPWAEVPMLVFIWRCAVLVCCVVVDSVPFTQVGTMHSTVCIAHMMVPLCS